MADCPEKNDFWVGEIIFLKLESGDCWDLLGFLLLRCRLLLGGLPGKKNDFWVGKIIFLKLETSDCWDLMGFLLLRCLLSKRLVVLAHIGGLSFFFLPYRFGGVGERGGMVLLHVNDPPFFTTPCGPFRFFGGSNKSPPFMSFLFSEQKK